MVRLATACVSGRVYRIRPSAGLSGILAIVYLLSSPGLTFVGAGHLDESLERLILSAAILCVAFLLYGVIGAVLWDGERQIVRTIATGMTGIHGTPTHEEHEALTRICNRFEVEAPHWAKGDGGGPGE